MFSKLEEARKNPAEHIKSVRNKASELSGYNSSGDLLPVPFINGRYRRNGYVIEKLAIPGEGDYVIPFLLFLPDSKLAKNRALIYLHPEGKATDAAPGGKIEKLVRKGYIVAAPDILGTGETKNTAVRELATGYTAVLIARSIPGIRAGDITRVVRYLKSRSDVDPFRIGAVGIDEMCIPLIHAATIEKSFKSVILSGSLISFRVVAVNRMVKTGLIPRTGGGTGHPYEVDFSWGVAGALKAYDLPDLIASLAPGRIVLAGLKNQLLQPAPAEVINKELEFAKSVYASKNADGNLKIIPRIDDLGLEIEWCFSIQE